jgi:Rrf2 family nitric oxide-sensitive transcriptional repressor
MQLTTFTDYSLRVLMYVAIAPQGRRATVPAVAEAYGISRSHLTKVVHHLGRNGVLRNVRGRGGGLELARAAEAISIGQVVRAASAHQVLVECFDRASDGCVVTRGCRLRHALAVAAEAFYKTLDGYSLADIVANRDVLAGLLGTPVIVGQPIARQRRSR